MADIFGKTEVLPSWLRDDGGERFTRAFQLGSSAARGAAEDQRANRRLTLEEDQAEVRKRMSETTLEGERLKLDDEKAFFAETPALSELGKVFQNSKTLPELDSARRAAVLRTPKAQQVADTMWSARAGQISKTKIDNYGNYLNEEMTGLKMLYGDNIPEDKINDARFNATVKADPDAAMKFAQAERVANIRADASIENTRIRAQIEADKIVSREKIAADRILSYSSKVEGDKIGAEISFGRFIDRHLEPYMREAADNRKEITRAEAVEELGTLYGTIMEKKKAVTQPVATKVPDGVTTAPQVTTKDQYDALPAGTEYIGKNGGRFRKP